jgi:phosphoribosyl 1,2-cyclic phosphodiesterase
MVTLLGVSCSWGAPNLAQPILVDGEHSRDHCAAVYIAPSGEGILIDAGHNIVRQIVTYAPECLTVERDMREAQTEIFGEAIQFRLAPQTINTSIRRVLLTHSHDDHINGITNLNQLAAVLGGPCDVHGSQETLNYVADPVTGSFKFVFAGKAVIGTGDQARVLKLVAKVLPDNGEHFLPDGTNVRTLEVRHGKTSATIFGLPGFVYAPDISHVTPQVVDFIADGNPHVVVLNCQSRNRKDHGSGDDYPHLGIEEFMLAAGAVGNRLSQKPIEFIAVHMQRAISDGFLEEQFNRFRSKARIPDNVMLSVGRDGIKRQLG